MVFAIKGKIYTVIFIVLIETFVKFLFYFYITNYNKWMKCKLDTMIIYKWMKM